MAECAEKGDDLTNVVNYESGKKADPSHHTDHIVNMSESRSVRPSHANILFLQQKLCLRNVGFVEIAPYRRLNNLDPMFIFDKTQFRF